MEVSGTKFIVKYAGWELDLGSYCIEKRLQGIQEGTVGGPWVACEKLVWNVVTNLYEALTVNRLRRERGGKWEYMFSRSLTQTEYNVSVSFWLINLDVFPYSRHSINFIFSGYNEDEIFHLYTNS